MGNGANRREADVERLRGLSGFLAATEGDGGTSCLLGFDLAKSLKLIADKRPFSIALKAI